MFHSQMNRWFAIQVRPQAEQMVAEMLTYKGYEIFLPMCRKRGARAVRAEVPLFTGYVFCRVRTEIQGLIVTTPGVVRILGCGRDPEPIPDIEIDSLKRVVQTGLPMRAWPRMEEGERVRLTGGPLRGCEGVVKTIDHESCVILSLTILRRSVATRVSREWLAPAC